MRQKNSFITLALLSLFGQLFSEAPLLTTAQPNKAPLLTTGDAKRAPLMMMSKTQKEDLHAKIMKTIPSKVSESLDELVSGLPEGILKSKEPLPGLAGAPEELPHYHEASGLHHDIEEILEKMNEKKHWNRIVRQVNAITKNITHDLEKRIPRKFERLKKLTLHIEQLYRMAAAKVESGEEPLAVVEERPATPVPLIAPKPVQEKKLIAPRRRGIR